MCSDSGKRFIVFAPRGWRWECNTCVMSPCPVPYSHFCRVRRRASTQLFFGNTLLAARKIGFSEPGKAYLAGLLHDIGIIAQLWVAPAEFRATMERASAEHIPLHEAEQAVLGITPRAAGLWLSAGTSHPI